MIGISFSICCMLFLGILSIYYFPKKKVNSTDNKIFSVLLVTNLIGTFIDVFGFAMFRILTVKNILNIIIAKVYLIYFVTYLFCLFMYIYKKVKSSNSNKYIYIYYIVLSVL